MAATFSYEIIATFDFLRSIGMKSLIERCFMRNCDMVNTFASKTVISVFRAEDGRHHIGEKIATERRRAVGQ